jgi:hypothetical protein
MDSIPDRERDYSISVAFRLVLGLILPPVRWTSELISRGYNNRRVEANHSRPYTAYVKNAWKYTSIPFPFTPVHG